MWKSELRTSSGQKSQDTTTWPLPPDWPQDIPLVRILTCGCTPISIEVLLRFQDHQPLYGPPDPDASPWKNHAGKKALTLLGLLASQPGCIASQDFVSQALRPGRHMAASGLPGEEDDLEEDRALKRPENLVTQLRRLLYPPVLLHLPESEQRALRHRLITRVKASQDSGAAYRLASFPLIWLDVEAMETHARQALTLEHFGDESLGEWQAVFEIGFRGPFLPHERYSDWAQWRRARVYELLWQSVDAQLKAMSQWSDQDAIDEASLRLLLARWQAQPENEDAFRPLAELLGKRERFQQAEEYYARLCEALEQEGRTPHERTEKVMQFVRTRAISRKPTSRERQTPMVISPMLALPARHNAASPFGYTADGRILDITNMDLLQQVISPEFGLSVRFEDPNKTLNETLHEFAILTDICRRLSEGSELQTAERILWAYLPRIEAFINSSSFKEPIWGARLVAEGYLLAASLVGHRNDLYRRQKYSEQALFYGEIAQDSTLQVAALRQIATTFNYQERFQNVLETYQRALPLLVDVSPLLRSCIYAALSGVYAQFQRRNEADHAIGLAYEHFGEHQGEEPDLLRSINASENLLIQWAGENHLKLGRLRQAEKVFSKLNVLDPHLRLPTRIRIEAIDARVQMFLAIDEMEQACSYLETALRLAIEVGSSLRLREVTQTLHLLRQQWPEEKPVLQLSDLLVELLINHSK
jgi:hypothetical protein